MIFKQIYSCALLGIVVIVGCGPASIPSLDVFPVTGRILINGKPPVRAEIRLQPSVPLNDPLKRSIEPYAIVQDDGTFRVGTYRGDDGAPLGEYALTMTWPEIEFGRSFNAGASVGCNRL